MIFLGAQEHQSNKTESEKFANPLRDNVVTENGIIRTFLMLCGIAHSITDNNSKQSKDDYGYFGWQREHRTLW